MGRKSKFTTEEKFEVVATILNGIDSAYNQARLLGIDRRTIEQWICNYRSLGKMVSSQPTRMFPTAKR